MGNNIPQHVAIIMDGNGRWARTRGLPKMAGHHAGVEAAKRTVEAAKDLGIKVLTFYTFSTENWKRPRGEVDALFSLLKDYLEREEEKLNKNNIRFVVIGRIEELPLPLQDRLKHVMASTGNNTGMVLNLALNYGARPEIIDAVRKASKDLLDGIIKIDELDEGRFSRYLYTRDLPDPDLLIRTSGELRLSNFLLWQLSYSELYFTKKLWPDFKRGDLEKAIREYQKRIRRFGG